MRCRGYFIKIALGTRLAESVKENVRLPLNIFFVSANVWLLLVVFKCFLKNMWLLLKDINEQLLLKEKNVLFRNYVHLINILKQKTDYNKKRRKHIFRSALLLCIFG